MLKHKRRYIIPYIVMLFVVSMIQPTPYKAATTGTPAVDINSPSIQGKNVTVAGTVEGYPFQSAEIVITGDNGFSTSTINVDLSTGQWSYQFPDEFSSGDYHYIINATATDLNSQQSTSTTDLNFTVDATAPTMSVTSPSIQKDKIIFGTVTDDHTPSNQIQMQLLDTNSNPVAGAVYNAPSTNSNEWSISLPKDLQDGTYNYIIQATDSYNNSSTINDSVTIDTVRPQVSSINVNLTDKASTYQPNEINLLKSDSVTYVKRDTSITFDITDDKQLDPDKIKNPIIVMDNNGTTFSGNVSITQKSSTVAEVTFSHDLPFLASTTYYILINPAMIDLNSNSPMATDAAGNPVYPVIKKITTERESDISKIPTDKTAYYNLNNPHGFNDTNTNTCGTCHSTHVSKGADLEQPSFNYSSYNYCMACHDGTVAAAPDNMHQNGHFPEYTNSNPPAVQTSAVDCSSCHNPHLDWNKDNPNLIKDHYVHLHNDATKQSDENYPFGKTIDSMTQPCETCHGNQSQIVEDQYVYTHNDSSQVNNSSYPYGQTINSLTQPCETCHQNVSQMVWDYDAAHEDNPIEVNYRTFDYKNSSATGEPNNYGLCFLCHDGTKTWTDSNKVAHPISNIKQFYDDTGTNDATNGSLSMHRITALDGSSNLKKSDGTTSNEGHIPCAACHDTHGSGNIKILNEKLGIEDRQSFSASVSEMTSDGILNVSKERQFCLACHNGQTAIYGVAGKAPDPTKSAGHSDTNTSCSECHGIGNTPEEKALSAAHAPTAGTP